MAWKGDAIFKTVEIQHFKEVPKSVLSHLEQRTKYYTSYHTDSLMLLSKSDQSVIKYFTCIILTLTGGLIQFIIQDLGRKVLDLDLHLTQVSSAGHVAQYQHKWAG